MCEKKFLNGIRKKPFSFLSLCMLFLCFLNASAYDYRAKKDLKEMPVLVFDIAQDEYVSYTNENLSSYLENKVYSQTTEKSVCKKFEKAYLKNNRNRIFIQSIEFSLDGKYAYIHALRAKNKH